MEYTFTLDYKVRAADSMSARLFIDGVPIDTWEWRRLAAPGSWKGVLVVNGRVVNGIIKEVLDGYHFLYRRNREVDDPSEESAFILVGRVYSIYGMNDQGEGVCIGRADSFAPGADSPKRSTIISPIRPAELEVWLLSQQYHSALVTR